MSDLKVKTPRKPEHTIFISPAGRTRLTARPRHRGPTRRKDRKMEIYIGPFTKLVI